MPTLFKLNLILMNIGKHSNLPTVWHFIAAVIVYILGNGLDLDLYLDLNIKLTCLSKLCRMYYMDQFDHMYPSYRHFGFIKSYIFCHGIVPT